MVSLPLQPTLTSLLKSLPPSPIQRADLDKLVKNTLGNITITSSAESRKGQWEYLLKDDIFSLAATEGKALQDSNSTYYDDLQSKLDVILTFTEQEACDPSFTFVVLQDLLETQTINSCSHIFSWIEARAERLTAGMVPQKGKALILLRTLNDLLRRLSKMGSTTIFCGRILTFLSGVFPLGERSGVNLRGEYGPTWDGVKIADTPSGDVVMEDGAQRDQGEKGAEDQMQVDGQETKKGPPPNLAEKKADFYNTFWSLQLPFSKPPIFALPNTFAEFQAAVNKVFPVIKEATAKERAMMGSRGGSGGPASLKRKREPSTEEVNSNEYFFAKFLTSPDLLDLEIADTHFRRQFLFQLLILLNHLLTFTKTAKSTWSSPRNRSLQMDFTLEQAEGQWVTETLNKTMEELRQTTPNGRAFAETVNVILEREKNWVKWKNELCAPFDKEPWSIEIGGKKMGWWRATRSVREKWMEPPEDWQYRLGSEALTEIWDMGYRDLHDLERPFQPGDVKDYLKRINQEDARIELRQKMLAKIQPPKTPSPAAAAPVVPKVEVPVKPVEVPAPMEAVLSTPPRSTASAVSPPLHPSLPPKPGSAIIAKPPIKQDVAPPPPLITPVAPQPILPQPSVPEVEQTPAVSQIVPQPTPQPNPPTDPQILKYEENKQRLAWLALRNARDRHLQHFGRIGTGDIAQLAKEIEKVPKVEDSATVEEATSGSPAVRASTMTIGDEEGPPKVEKAGDVKMEE